MRIEATPKRRGFRVIDLLIAVALTVCVLLFFLPRIARNLNGGKDDDGRVRGRADEAVSFNNLKQITLAAINYADQNRGILPCGPMPILDDNVKRGGFGPCLFLILPQMDHDSVYKATRVTVGDFDMYLSLAGEGKGVESYRATDDPSAEASADRTNYLANELALPARRVHFPASLGDGPSRTIFFAEAYSRTTDTVSFAGADAVWTGQRRWWDNPTWRPVRQGAMFQCDPPADGASASFPQGFSRRGMLVSLGDGSARTVSASVSAATFHAACTPSSGDGIGADW